LPFSILIFSPFEYLDRFKNFCKLSLQMSYHCWHDHQFRYPSLRGIREKLVMNVYIQSNFYLDSFVFEF
jgi:hypothetical protein